VSCAPLRRNAAAYETASDSLPGRLFWTEVGTLYDWTVTTAPHVVGVYETVLYAPDPVETARFYEEVLNLRPLEEPDELSAAFRLPDGRMLLIFDTERASRPGRRVPSHGAHGPGHVAFSVAPGALDSLAAALRQRGVEVEREIGWDAGGRSIYFRDPAGNSVELVEGEAWPEAPG
jgi:catechol 2,3-dioxygenase-like lactoylglutathione lyase family enzyme